MHLFFTLCAPPALSKTLFFVCPRDWNVCALQPKFWSGSELGVRPDNYKEVSSSHRCYLVPSLRLHPLHPLLLQSFLQDIAESDLENLQARGTDLSSVDGKILARAIMSFVSVDLANTELRDDQLEDIFQNIASVGHLRLKSLTLDRNDFSVIPTTDLMSQALVRLEAVSLWKTRLKFYQLDRLFCEIAESESLELRSLDLSFTLISSVTASLLAKALVRLEAVVLFDTRLDDSAVLSLLTEISVSEKLTLRSLDIRYNQLSCVPPQLLSRSLVRLEEVDLWNTLLTSHQLHSILEAIARSTQLNLSKLSLKGLDLSPASSDLLSQAMVRLAQIDLTATKLSGDQVTSLLNTILTEDQTSLAVLNLSGNNLSLVEPSLLAGAVVKLREVSLDQTFITQTQFEEILTTVLDSSSHRLKILALNFNSNTNLASAERISGARGKLCSLEL